MRILLLNWKDPSEREAGGAEQYVQMISERWSAQGHAVAMFVPRVDDLPARERIGGVDYIRAGSRTTVFFHARRFVRRNQATWDLVIESISTRPFHCHRLLSRDRAAALYHQVADEVWHREFRFPFSHLGRHVVEPWWIRRMAGARVVAVSPSTALTLRQRGIDVAAIAPPGCALPERYEPRSLPDEVRLVFLGRLSRTKCPDAAVDAFRLVRKRLPRAHLDVIGDGYLRKELEALRVPGVVFHGRVSEARKWELLNTATLLLLPGTREGWGIVAMEAAAAGLPVAAYDIAGFRDAVDDGHTGVLTPPTATGLADAALGLLNAPERWRAMSAQARKRAEEHSWPACGDRLMDCLTTPQETSAEVLPAGPLTSAKADDHPAPPYNPRDDQHRRREGSAGPGPAPRG